MKTKITVILLVIFITAGVVLYASLSMKGDRILIKPKTIQSYFDSSYNEDLIKSGFINTNSSKTFKEDKIRNSWKKEGFQFYTNEEITQFLKDNDFVLGKSSQYIKNVPEKAGIQIIKSLYSLRHKSLVYTLTLTPDNKNYELSDKDVFAKGQNITWETVYPKRLHDILSSDAISRLSIIDTDFWELKYNNELPVFVIGGANDFNTEGMNIIDGILKAIPPKDPIAVVKVDEGYVQIAQW